MQLLAEEEEARARRDMAAESEKKKNLRAAPGRGSKAEGRSAMATFPVAPLSLALTLTQISLFWVFTLTEVDD